jgi:hypothetical protein
MALEEAEAAIMNSGSPVLLLSCSPDLAEGD